MLVKQVCIRFNLLCMCIAEHLCNCNLSCTGGKNIQISLLIQHSAFLSVAKNCMLFCTCLYVHCVRMFPLANSMPPKWRRVTVPPASKRTQSSTSMAHDNSPDGAVSSSTSIDQLLSLTVKVPRSHLQARLLPTSGNKAALADCLFRHLHTSNHQVSNNSENNLDGDDVTEYTSVYN